MRVERRDTGIYYIPISEKYKTIDLETSLFFDIETTGFSAKSTKLYMIGVLYADASTKTFHSIQWFLDDYTEEACLLLGFIEFLKEYTCLIHYNGQGFDIPYVEAKCLTYNILFDFSSFTHIDLYKHVSSMKNIFKTENLKQKTMEMFLGLNRKDIFSGKDLISVYYKFMESHDEKAVSFLLLHNYEDITGMVSLLDILSYNDIFNGCFNFTKLEINTYTSSDSLAKKEAVFEFLLDTPVPKRVSFGNHEYYMTAFDSKLKIKIQVYTDELKYFYPNYKDYYYLPEEDMSIHKSVAFYVDKNFRTRAKAANCYSRKTGQFLPQYTDIISPYFKIDYYDKKTYFEMTDDFCNNTERIMNYAVHVLEYLKKS